MKLFKNFSFSLIVIIGVISLFSLCSATTVASSAVDNDFYVYVTSTSDPAHTVNINWRSSENYEGIVRFDVDSVGGVPESYSLSVDNDECETTSDFDGYIHHMELTGLEPDTKYHFVCGDSEHGWSDELSFKTAPVERENIRFVVGGDSRWDARSDHPHPDWPQSRDEVTKLLSIHDPDFVIFVGDFIWNSEEQPGPDTWDNWLRAWYKYARDSDNRLITLIPVFGNHEVGPYPQPSVYDPESDASNFYALFDLPVRENRYAWYSLNWGPDLHVTVLDSEIRWSGSEVWGEQVHWLKSDLMKAQDNLWKVAIAHRPVFSAGGSDQSFKTDWVPEFDLFHVDFYFNGHIHDYERTYPLNSSISSDNIENTSPENGTVYLTSGGWGAPLGGWGSKWWTVKGPIDKYHYTLVNIRENGLLHLEAVDWNNEVFDEYYVQKNVSPESGGGLPMNLVIGVSLGILIILLSLFFFVYRR